MNIRKTLGALLGGGALIMALAGTATADPGNQSNVWWNAGASDCTGGPNGDFTVGQGEVAWIFVHPQTDGPGTLTANFLNAGQKTAPSYIQGNVKYMIVTAAPDELLTFSDNLEGGPLNLSHTCYNTESSSSSSSSSSTSFTSSESGSSTTDSSSSSTSFTSSESGSSTTDSSSSTTSFTSSESGSSTTDSSSSTTSFTSSESGESSTPSEPNTATLGDSGPSGPSGGSWLLIAALGMLAGSAIVLMPARAKNRR